MRYLYICIFTVVFSGCSIIDAREDNGIGHPYIATEQSIKTAGISTVIAVQLYVVPLLITIPMNLIDISFSVITDTILLPFDLFTEPEKPNRDTTPLNGLKI